MTEIITKDKEMIEGALQSEATVHTGDREGSATEEKPVRREIDIFDVLPAEAIADANRLGFEFLAERGYDALGAWEDPEKLAALESELIKRGEELRYSGAFDTDPVTGRLTAILIWYGLYREGLCIARSRGLKLVPNESEEAEEVAADDK